MVSNCPLSFDLIPTDTERHGKKWQRTLQLHKYCYANAADIEYPKCGAHFKRELEPNKTNERQRF